MSKNPPKQVYLESGQEVLNNYELLNFIRDHKKIIRFELLVSLYLVSRRNSVLGCSFPSRDTILRDTGISKPQLSKSVKILEDIGILIVINTGKTTDKFGKTKHDGRTGNIYFFCYDIEYHHDLVVDNEEHPLNKQPYYFDCFIEAFDVYNSK